MIGGSTEFAFPELNHGEKIERRERRGEFNSGVEERGGAGRAVNGSRFVNAGAEEGLIALVNSPKSILRRAQEL